MINGVRHRISIAYIGGLYVFSEMGGGYPKNKFNWTVGSNTLSHELGHNLGVYHANSWECKKKKPAVLYGDECQHTEYGNIYDIMGNSYGALHFNAYFKDKFGWLQNSVVTITKSGKYRIAPIESSQGIRAAKIQAPGSNEQFYVEYRQPIGFDSSLNDPAISSNKDAVKINWVPVSYSYYQHSRLLDINQTTYPNDGLDWLDVVSKPVRSFKDQGR